MQRVFRRREYVTKCRHLPAVAGLVFSLFYVGCTAEESFTSGRLQPLCEELIPVCSTKASCVLDQQSVLDAEFPGGHRFIVHSIDDDRTLVLRMLLADEVFPGTELFIRTYTPGCLDFKEERLLDVDFFDMAGADGILEFHFPLGGRGDHLVELFSDMSARYLLAVELE